MIANDLSGIGPGSTHLSLVSTNTDSLLKLLKQVVGIDVGQHPHVVPLQVVGGDLLMNGKGARRGNVRKSKTRRRYFWSRK